MLNWISFNSFICISLIELRIRQLMFHWIPSAAKLILLPQHFLSTFLQLNEIARALSLSPPHLPTYLRLTSCVSVTFLIYIYLKPHIIMPLSTFTSSMTSCSILLLNIGDSKSFILRCLFVCLFFTLHFSLVSLTCSFGFNYHFMLWFFICVSPCMTSQTNYKLSHITFLLFTFLTLFQA